MYWLQLVVIVALLAAVGWLAIGGGGHMSEPMPDRPDLALPNEGMLARTDVDRVRFSVGARGYRMDEVDDVLDRLANEIELREDRIRELEGRAPRTDASLGGDDASLEGDGEDAESEPTSTEPAVNSIVSESETVSEPVSGPEFATDSAVSASISDTENVSAESKTTDSKTEATDRATAPVQSTAENEETVE